MKKALLLIAHGSRRTQSNNEVAELADILRVIGQKEYAVVKHAFLELAEPSIEAAIDQCVDAGVNELVVFPYFLSAGRHVAEDVPEEIEQAETRHPDLTVRLLPHFGALEKMPQLILESASV